MAAECLLTWDQDSAALSNVISIHTSASYILRRCILWKWQWPCFTLTRRDICHESLAEKITHVSLLFILKKKKQRSKHLDGNDSDRVTGICMQSYFQLRACFAICYPGCCSGRTARPPGNGPWNIQATDYSAQPGTLKLCILVFI